METLIVFSVMGFMLLALLAGSTRSDYKEMRRGKDDLIRSWEKYYEKTQEYRPIETFTIEYIDGGVETVQGESFDTGDGSIEIYDEYAKVVLRINESEIKTLRTDRSDSVIKGPKERIR